jgi:DNA primase
VNFEMGVIDEIKQRVDIVEVVSEYVPGLKKAGRNFKALCPFHAEKVPSFYVFPERQSWHCFGSCGTGGDVFSFVMKKEGIDFGEALRLLAQRTGVSLSQKQPDEREKETERLRYMNEAVAEYYHRLLIHSSEAKEVRAYLARRGISEKSIENFQLGFSLDNWEALRQYLIGKGYKENELLAAGLLVEKEQGGSYDRFRNRLMFPIRDISGRVLGFGARVLDDSLPKYMNSPQTAIFDKSSILYGIDHAKASIRRKDVAVVVEGYMDAIIAHQYGYENVVASMGTALTEKQVSIFKRLTKNLTLALDADTAGEMATLRGEGVIAHTFGQPVSVPGWVDARILGYESLYDAEWKVAVLPAGKDPDEIIREDAQHWQQLVDKAMPLLDYIFDVVVSKLDLTKLEDKSSAVDQLSVVLNNIKGPIRRAHYIAHYVQKLARLTGVDEQPLALAFKRARPFKQKREAAPQPSALIPFISSASPLEEYCLFLLIRYPELRGWADELSADYFEHSENRELFLAWRNAPDLDSMRRGLEKALQEYLEALLTKALPPINERTCEDALADCVHRLQERWLRGLKLKEELLISDAQSEGDATGLEKQQELELSVKTTSTQLGKVFLHKRAKKPNGKS